MTAENRAEITPVFAVVGRVNKGKSSIIATLAEDDRIRIGPRPGTTTDVREFPVRLDSRLLFVLVDTPGFEEATRALAWLRARERTAADRPALVEALVREHEGTPDFVEERKLLRPILDGAAVLYVVDASRPYRPNYEAEMEILRWTGQPRIALINRIRHGGASGPGGPGGAAADHAEEWRRALDQYFKVVRDFDAWSATFQERVRLLETVRELRDGWRPAIDEAVAALRADRERRRAEAAAVIAELLEFALTFTLAVTVDEDAHPADESRALEERFHQELREREEVARRRVEALYHHDRLVWEEEELERPAFDRDLFAESTWRSFGLSAGQVVGAWTAAGAGAGGTVDVAVGGASFLAGAAIGALAGLGVGVWQLGRRFARTVTEKRAAEDLRKGEGPGRAFRVGPHAHLNFPWVLLDRALLHYDVVASRTHARRDAARASDAEQGSHGVVAALPKESRDAMNRLFAALRDEYDDVPRDLRDELHRRTADLLRRVDDTSGAP